MTLRQLSTFSRRVEELSREYGGVKIRKSQNEMESVSNFVRIIKELPFPSAIGILTASTKNK